MSGFTPGPWRVRPSMSKNPVEAGDMGITAIVDGREAAIGEAWSMLSSTIALPARENAQLWAAAPDLLAACKAALVPAGDTSEEVREQLRAAIARAEGSTQ